MPGLTNYEKQVCCVKFDLRCHAWLGRTTNAPMLHDGLRPYNSSVTADVDELDDVDLVIAVGGLGIAVFVCCCLLVCCCRRCRAGRASAAAKGGKGRTKGSEASSEESGPDPKQALGAGSEEGELCYKYRKDVKKALSLRKKEKDGEKRDMVKFQLVEMHDRLPPLSRFNRTFKLDDWQCRVLEMVDQELSAVVCAPTSSGKTEIGRAHV